MAHRLGTLCLGLTLIAMGYFVGRWHYSPVPRLIEVRESASLTATLPSQRKVTAQTMREALASRSGKGAERIQSLLNIAESLSPEDFREALGDIRYAMNHSTPAEEVTAFKAILRRYAVESPHEAIAYVQSLSFENIKEDGFEAIFESWAASDIDAATAYMSNPSSDVSVMGERFQHAMIKAVARQMSHTAPGQTADWLAKLPDSAAGTAYSYAAKELALFDGEMAAEIGGSAPEIHLPWITRHVALNWAREDPTAAIDWVRSKLPAGSDQDESVRYALSGWGKLDPKAAAEFVTQNPDSPASHYETVVREWAYRQPEAASGWVQQLPPEDQTTPTGELVGRWVQRDPEAASGWLVSMPDGSAKDEGIRQLTNVLVDSDPEGAATWAASTSEPSQRLSQMSRMLKTWSHQESANAAAWLETVSLPPEEKQQLEGVLSQ